MHAPRSIPGFILLLIAAAWLALPAGIAAHQHVTAGSYQLVIGWGSEPALAGQPNRIEVFVSDATDKPVVDLDAGALSVVVSSAGQDSDALQLSPAFDVEEGFGSPGEYSADIIPTTPGDYAFHFTGKIHDQDVDVSVTSGPETFSSVEASSDLEFPVKQPTLTEVGTRLDRIDGRIDALQSSAPGADAIAAANASAAAAKSAADQALLVGGLLGALGVVLAIVAIVVARRSGAAARPA